MKLTGKTLIIAATPFQCICAIEAIKVFGIIEYSFIVPSSIPNRVAQIRELLSFYTIKASFIESGNFFPFLKKNVITDIKLGYFENALCCDFKSPNMNLLAARYLKKKGKLIYADDGFTSIYPLNNIVYKDKKVSLKMILPKILCKYKGISDNCYFSIFTPGATKFKVIKNNLDILKSNVKQEISGVFVLGTVVQFVESLMDTTNFKDYFNALINYIEFKYPNEQIYFSPHSRSKEDKALNQLCIDHDVKIINSKYSVEIDYSLNGYNPKSIFAFGSTALITLKKMYSNADIVNIYLPSNKANFIVKNKMINEYLAKEGIPTIKLI